MMLLLINSTWVWGVNSGAYTWKSLVKEKTPGGCSHFNFFQNKMEVHIKTFNIKDYNHAKFRVSKKMGGVNLPPPPQAKWPPQDARLNLVITCKTLTITVIFNEKPNELIVHVKLSRNVAIFYRQEPVSLFQG